MNNLDELRDLKKLLDDGVIDEDDFTAKKRKLLDLDVPEGTETIKTEGKIEQGKSLEEYEKELIQETKVVEISQNDNSDNLRKYYEKERLKELGKLDAHEEIRREREAVRSTVVSTGMSKIKKILKWILTMFLLITGVGLFMQPMGGILISVVEGIMFMILGLMACPNVTEYTRNFKVYTKLKPGIAVALVLILIVLMNTSVKAI